MHHLDIVHMLVSSLIHGLIYATIFKAFHHLSVAGAATVTIVGIVAIWVVKRTLNRR